MKSKKNIWEMRDRLVEFLCEIQTVYRLECLMICEWFWFGVGEDFVGLIDKGTFTNHMQIFATGLLIFLGISLNY